MPAAIVLLVLILTYIGMAAGRIAWLRVDRTGIALLAVIALLASGEMTLDHFGAACRIGLYRPVRTHDGRNAGRHDRAPGADGGNRRRVVRGARQRHPG